MYLKADFVVIGAGTVGLPVAVLLAKQLDKQIVVLESGDKQQFDLKHPLNKVVMRSDQYKGADYGRYRCLGGTSSRWGGALIPFQSSDLEYESWPIGMPELEKYISQAEALFGLEKGAYDDAEFPFSLTDDFVVRAAKWPPMNNLNVYTLLADECTHLQNLDIWINATTTKLLAENQNYVDITAQSLTGDTINIRTEQVIVAAGAIETTRLALLIDRQNKQAISQVSPGLGCYFADHISVPIATIATKVPENLNRVFGFRFGEKGSLRNSRIELANDTPLRNTLPPSFTHIETKMNKPSGFDALRDFFKCIQMQKPPSISIFAQLLKHAPWLTRALWWRYIHKHLLFPTNADLVAHVVIQQTPEQDNRITLSKTKKDIFDLPLAEIKWNIKSQDINNILQSADAIESIWKNTDLSSLGDWSSHDRSLIISDALNNGGYYHPTGSTRMGGRPSKGVVDTDLRIFPFPRIQLLATSVLPSGGGANPTMMLMCLGMRCVEQHVTPMLNSVKF